MFCGQICFPSSGLLLPKQVSLHGDYLHCNALYARNKQWNKTEEPTGIAILLYQHAASNKISRLLSKCRMKTHHLPVKKTTQGKVGLKTLAVLCVPCGCGGCMSDNQEFRNQMQGAHKAPFPGPAREFSCSRTYNGYRTAWNSATLQNGSGRKLCGLLG
jgi:hypothetical protein